MAEYDKERRDERIEKVQAARDTLPRWPWARFGDPEFERRANAKLLVAGKVWTPMAGNLVLLGPTGDGKTAVATAIAQRLLDAAVASDLAEREQRWATGLRFASAPELVTARRENRFGTGEAPLVRSAMLAAVLILDELGFEPADSVILEVTDARYRTNRVTITTSGLTEDGLSARYGDAVARRLSELGVVVSTHEVRT